MRTWVLGVLLGLLWWEGVDRGWEIGLALDPDGVSAAQLAEARVAQAGSADRDELRRSLLTKYGPESPWAAQWRSRWEERDYSDRTVSLETLSEHHRSSSESVTRLSAAHWRAVQRVARPAYFGALKLET